MTQELSPCKICGSSDILDKGHGIECLNCGVFLGDGSKTRDMGGYIKVWNTRAYETTLEAAEKALVEVNEKSHFVPASVQSALTLIRAAKGGD